MAPLSWRHHTLLQALLTRGPLPERDFHAFYPGTPSERYSPLLSLRARRSPASVRRNAGSALLARRKSAAPGVPYNVWTKERVLWGGVKRAGFELLTSFSIRGNPTCLAISQSKRGGATGTMAPLPWRQWHHAMLQALLSRGPLAEPDFFAIFSAVSDRDPATHQQLFNDTLLKINKDLAYLQFELRACINQYDGMVYYGVVNNIADEESKLGTKYSVPQIAFYKGVLEAVVQEAGNDGSITCIDALNIRLDNQVIIVDGSQDSQSRLPTSIKNFTMSQKEKALDELIRDRWLSYTPTGKIGLGIRSFLDLRSWFRDNDIPSCVVCNESCIKASSCPNDGCNVRIHEYCLRKKFSQRKASRACPGCGTEWPREDGEASGDDDANEPGEDQAASASRSSRKKSKGVKAELVEENNNAGPSTAVPRTRRTTMRSAKAEAVEAAQEASSAGASKATRTSKRRKK